MQLSAHLSLYCVCVCVFVVLMYALGVDASHIPVFQFQISILFRPSRPFSLYLCLRLSLSVLSHLTECIQTNMLQFFWHPQYNYDGKSIFLSTLDFNHGLCGFKRLSDQHWYWPFTMRVSVEWKKGRYWNKKKSMILLIACINCIWTPILSVSIGVFHFKWNKHQK